VQKCLKNGGKSAIANAPGKLAQLATGKKGEQIEPILQCEDTKKMAYFYKIPFMANFSISDPCQSPSFSLDDFSKTRFNLLNLNSHCMDAAQNQNEEVNKIGDKWCF
jgi:hypothetical protein